MQPAPLFLPYAAPLGLIRSCSTLGCALLIMVALLAVFGSGVVANWQVLGLFAFIGLLSLFVAVLLEKSRRGTKRMVVLDGAYLTAPSSLFGEDVTLDLTTLQRIKSKGRGQGAWISVSCGGEKLVLSARFMARSDFGKLRHALKAREAMGD